MYHLEREEIMKKKSIEQTYRKLNEVEHILKRPMRYVGALEPTVDDTYFITDNATIGWGELSYSPAFLKIFDEIITNSADFSKTSEGKHLNKIDVTVDKVTGEISVMDNGGIPVVIHEEYKQYVPEIIFGELRSGSNFDDDEASDASGQNGEGSTLTNIFSTKFLVETSDGKNKFTCCYYENMSKKDKPTIVASKKKFTKISYLPDYAKLSTKMDDDHFNMLMRRTYEVAACNSHIAVTFNGMPIKIKSFSDFAKMFNDKRLTFGNDRMQVSMFPSQDGFKHISFVNSTHTKQGGTHVDYVSSQIINKIRDYINKKTKQDVKPYDIKKHFFLIINATVNNPRYDTQTKVNLTTPQKDFGSTITIDDKTIKTIIKSDVVASIIEWAEKRKVAEEQADVDKKNKEMGKGSFRHIKKYEPATSKSRNKCILFIAEGDSAAKSLQSARNPEIHGVYPTKGKPINVKDKPLSKLTENKELIEMMQIIGLQFNKKPSKDLLRYGKIMISADQDLDGVHLCGLHISNFNHLWPQLFEYGVIYKLETPIVRIVQGKTELEFMSLSDFESWKSKQTKTFSYTYLKGLGSNDTKYFKKYMNDEKYHIPIVIENQEDKHALNIAFNKDMSDERKKFIYG